ncbi:MAG: glycosyltransferase family 4 protein, partial [Acidobacteria bacterium]|nr:glycosyltransferase family 4 protein [Acidobacteriota bacterium]
MKILALVPEAYGGFGGIARAEADLLDAMSADSRINSIEVLPRLIRSDSFRHPDSVQVVRAAARGKLAFAFAALSRSLADWDVVFCGHLNLAPLAILLARLRRRPAILMIHGIDAWEPPSSRLRRWSGRSFDAVISVSHVTARRFRAWSRVPAESIRVIPNMIDLSRYAPGDPERGVLEKLDIEQSPYLMTLGRLDTRERYKGFDEVLEVMPRLLEIEPDLKYVIAGDGDDRPRLEQKAEDLGIRRAVRFAGRVSEEEKLSLYRGARVFVMPSRGEGFGIVILEALGCGASVVGSTTDGTREALLHGRLGVLVEPENQD